MTTITASSVKDDAAYREAVRTILTHSGRLMIGPSPKERIEATIGAAILYLDGQINTRGSGRVYLLPFPKTRTIPVQKQWHEACNAAREGVKRLRSIHLRHEEWREKLKSSSGSERLKEKLDRVVQLDLERVEQILDEAEQTELPKGYGRDG